VEESPAPVSCLDQGAPTCNGDCEAKILWKKVWDAAVTEMKLTTIASLVQEEETLHSDAELYRHIGLVPCR
jgi:DNA-binding IscR family transcriptional regulator